MRVDGILVDLLISCLRRPRRAASLFAPGERFSSGQAQTNLEADERL